MGVVLQVQLGLLLVIHLLGDVRHLVVVVLALLHLTGQTCLRTLVLHLSTHHLVTMHCQQLTVLLVGLPGLLGDALVLCGQFVVDLL